MKKYFFYAAMAVATMASCTSEDDLTVDPVNPNPDAEEKVALNLGVSTPSMTVGSRGTGMVGFVGTAADNATKASWDSQELFITMVNKETNTEYEEPDGKKYFKGLQFRAPKKEDGNNEGLIRMYQSYDTLNNQGILEYKYYPVTGKYMFYGWHKDDATGGTQTYFGKTSAGADSASVSAIVIDGSQDLLAANTDTLTATKPVSGEPYYAAANALDTDTYATMVANQFSARTARNNFTPILDFKHTLARLKFHVKAGKGTDAALNYKVRNYNNTDDSLVVRTGYDITLGQGGNWADTIITDTTHLAGMLNGAIYVTGIKVLDVYDEITLDLVKQIATANTAKEDTSFVLKSTPEQAGADGKLLQDLVAVAPSYAYGYDYGGDKDNTLGALSDEIGESIMYLPVNEGSEGTDSIVKIQVQLGQCLIKTENETGASPKYTYYWDTPKPVTLTLSASTIKFPTGSGFTDANDKVFKAGRSYNVYITIYGRERIEVSANLVPWEAGGDVDTDIEDGYQN